MEAFIITFRESLEAAIIVGILFAVLQSCKAEQFKKYVWAGVAAGVVLSIVFAWVFAEFFGGFSGKTEKIYEGFLMLGVAAFITHMVFWMKGQVGVFKKNISLKVEASLLTKAVLPMFLIAFFSVVREGIETVIFFQAIDIQSDTGISVLGGIIGVISAVILATVIQQLAIKISYKKFFRITGVLLIFIAAGLIAHGIVEFQGAGWLVTFKKPLFDLSAILSEKTGLGSFLKALFGYDANPSLIAVLGYVSFLTVAFWKWVKK